MGNFLFFDNITTIPLRLYKFHKNYTDFNYFHTIISFTIYNTYYKMYVSETKQKYYKYIVSSYKMFNIDK